MPDLEPEKVTRRARGADYPPGLYAVQIPRLADPAGFARCLTLVQRSAGNYDSTLRTWHIATSAPGDHRAAMLAQMAELGAVISREDTQGPDA